MNPETSNHLIYSAIRWFYTSMFNSATYLVVEIDSGIISPQSFSPDRGALSGRKEPLPSRRAPAVSPKFTY